jgi:hypothetical protein
LSDTERDNYIATWKRLLNENSPIRAIREKKLVSVSLDDQDNLLFSVLDRQWRKVHRVLGEAMAKSYDGPFMQSDFFVLRARVLRLVAERRFEGRGDFFSVHDDLGELMRQSDVRLR